MTSSSIVEPAHGLTGIVRAIVTAGAVAYVVLYVGMALVRLRYPFELEWMEGSIVEHVRRAAAGEKIYVPPSIDFVPFLYPPLYYYVSAVVALATEVGFFPLRLVSFGASLGVFAMVFSLIKRETNDRFAGIFGIGLFAATFRAGGAWLDTARVDSLFLLLLFAAVYLVRFGRSLRVLAAAGAVLALSALTKQTSLVMAPALAVYLFVIDWRKGFAFIGGFAATFGGITLVLEALHGDWYFFYVFRLPAHIQDVGNVTLSFWTADILRPMAVGAVLSLGYSVSALTRLQDRRNLFYPMLGVSLLLTSWTTRAHSGAFDNVLIPAYAGLAILSALSLHDLAQALTNRQAVYVYTLYLVQLAMLLYSPRAQMPTANDRALGQQLVEIIARAPGEVYVPWHSSLSALAGKRTFAHSQAVADILRAGDPEITQRLLSDISRAVREQRFQLIIVDRVDSWLGPEFEAKYVRVRTVFERDGFWPLTGARTRPEWIYVPR